MPTLPNVTCGESFGQIQKVAFQRLRKSDGSQNTFTPGTQQAGSIIKLAAWESFLSAEDGTKIIVSPFINSPAESGGDARMTGGGNDDLGGIPDVLGSNPVQFTGSMRALPQAVAAAMKELTCEANAGNLGVFLFDENGKIEAIEVSTGVYAPIPVRAFFVGDKIHGNFDAKDSNAISWYYPTNYSDKLAIVAPEFNPLTDLQNADE